MTNFRVLYRNEQEHKYVLRNTEDGMLTMVESSVPLPPFLLTGPLEDASQGNPVELRASTAGGRGWTVIVRGYTIDEACAERFVA